MTTIGIHAVPQQAEHGNMNPPLRIAEFFCGIGGVAEAARQLSDVSAHSQRFQFVTAIDIDRSSGEVYFHNFARKVEHRTIESLDFDSLSSHLNADTWWLSPPCQPYCRRGRGQHESDPRCDALRAIITWLEKCPRDLPTRIALENVPEFADSTDHQRLCDSLRNNGFSLWSGELCPTQFGIPNRRRRYYMIARRDRASVPAPQVPETPSHWNFTVADVLETQPSLDLWLDHATANAYHAALDIVDAADPNVCTACFASGYGKSIVRSGSYLAVENRLRRFSPVEVARLLGFSTSFMFPSQVSIRNRWKMLGNSLSIPVVKSVLTSLGSI